MSKQLLCHSKFTGVDYTQQNGRKQLLSRNLNLRLHKTSCFKPVLLYVIAATRPDQI